MTCATHPDTEAAACCARCGLSYCDDCLLTLRDERICANCKGEALRDVLSGTQTSRLPLARTSARFVALLVDRSMLWIVMYSVLRYAIRYRRKLPAFLALRSLHNLQLAAQIAIVIAYFLYDALMVAWRGQTLGKMLLRVRVVEQDGSQVTRRTAFLRSFPFLLTAATGIAVSMASKPAAASLVALILWFLDYGLGLFTAERVTVHDLLAKTRVLRADA